VSRLILGAACCCLLAPSAPLTRADEATLPPISCHGFEDGERIDIRLPGRLVSWVAPRKSRGVRDLVLLVEPANSAADGDDGPCDDTDRQPLSLWRVDLQDECPRLERLIETLPGDGDALHVHDLDDDGDDELLLLRPTQLLLLRPGEGDGVAVLSADPFEVHAGEVRSTGLVLGARQRFVPVASLGSVAFYEMNETGERWKVASRAEIPVEAEMQFGRVRVRSPAVRWLGADARGHDRFATVPDEVDPRRMRVWLFDPGARKTEECWARFPDAEQVIERKFHMLDGKPILIVTTMPADKLSLFGNKRIRLFHLEPDRSRLGHDPFFALTSRIEQWQDATFHFVDVNADERTDLVLGYWKGWKKGKIVLDAYLGNEDGSFDDSPRSTVFPVEEGHRSYFDYGRDLTGDGRREGRS
jgi:hypothetical protein